MVGDGNYIFAGGARLTAIDVSDPTRPQVVDSNDMQVQALAFEGHNLYAAEGHGFHIFDVTNPASPTEVAFVGTADAVNGLVALGGYVYLTSGLQFCTVNVQNLANPGQLNCIPTFGFPGPVEVAGPYAYVGSQGFSVLTVIDVSDPASKPIGYPFDSGVCSWRSYRSCAVQTPRVCSSRGRWPHSR